MVRTIRYPVVWKPSLYMFLSLALSISTHEGQFYWYTNKTPPNPGFSQVKVRFLACLMWLLISRSVEQSNSNLSFREQNNVNLDLQHNGLVLHDLKSVAWMTQRCSLFRKMGLQLENKMRPTYEELDVFSLIKKKIRIQIRVEDESGPRWLDAWLQVPSN